MCTTSMAADFAGCLPPNVWTSDTYSQFLQLMAKLQQIDAKLGLPNCEDQEKLKWMKSIEDRLANIEKSVTPKKSTRKKKS